MEKLLRLLNIIATILVIFTCIVVLNFPIKQISKPIPATQTNTVTKSITENVIKYEYITPNTIGLLVLLVIILLVIVGSGYAYFNTTKTKSDHLDLL